MAAARRLRVLYLSHAFMVGGAEEMVLNLVRHLPPTAMSRSSARFMSRARLAWRSRRPASRFGRWAACPASGSARPRGIYRYLRETRPDIVHTFLLTASLYGRFAAIAARVPIVIGTEVNIYERKQRHHAFAERC